MLGVSDIQPLLVLGGLVKAVVAVQAAAGADDLDGLLGIAAPFGEENGTSLSSFSSCVHHIVDFPLRPPRFVPHLSSIPIPIPIQREFDSTEGPHKALTFFYCFVSVTDFCPEKEEEVIFLTKEESKLFPILGLGKDTEKPSFDSYRLPKILGVFCKIYFYLSSETYSNLFYKI